MAYIGNQPGTGVRSRFIYTATASQTTFTGADNNSKTLKYSDADYIDVYLNGVCLVPVTDYAASTKTSVVLTQAASLNDTLEVVAYDIATISDTVSKADGGTFNDGITITTADNTTQLTLESTDADANSGPVLELYRNSSSPADDDVLGEIEFHGENDADEKIQYGLIAAKLQDASDGTEDVRLSFKTITAGTERERVTIQPTEVVINEDSQDLDFRVESDGNANMLFVDAGNNSVLVATTGVDPHNASSSSDLGVAIRDDGRFHGGVTGQNAMSLNRLDDGDILTFKTNGSLVGHIGGHGGSFHMVNNSTGGFRFATSGGQTRIAGADENGNFEDDAHDIGAPSVRWDDIYATNTTIQTSDENEKQNIESLTNAEITAATAISKLFKTYKWKSKVTAKGDDARTHTGVVAQQVQSAMSDAGLDASKYAFWCSNTWWETQTEVAAVEADEEKGIEAKDAYTRTDTYDTKDEAPEGATERTRLGLRYAELLAFIGAATEQRLTSIESRLTALEAG